MNRLQRAGSLDQYISISIES